MSDIGKKKYCGGKRLKLDGILKYTDYCTAFYDGESSMVYFYDEIKDKGIERQKVSGKVEADMVMRAWKDNAPMGVICDILEG